MSTPSGSHRIVATPTPGQLKQDEERARLAAEQRRRWKETASHPVPHVSRVPPGMSFRKKVFIWVTVTVVVALGLILAVRYFA